MSSECVMAVQSLKTAIIHQLHKNTQALTQVLFDVRAGNSNLTKSLSENSNHAMYQEENPHRGLLFLQNYQN